MFITQHQKYILSWTIMHFKSLVWVTFVGNNGLENISQLYQDDQPQRVRQAHYIKYCTDKVLGCATFWYEQLQSFNDNLHSVMSDMYSIPNLFHMFALLKYHMPLDFSLSWQDEISTQKTNYKKLLRLYTLRLKCM